jgi:hypothetical protein
LIDAVKIEISSRTTTNPVVVNHSGAVGIISRGEMTEEEAGEEEEEEVA